MLAARLAVIHVCHLEMTRLNYLSQQKEFVPAAVNSLSHWPVVPDLFQQESPVLQSVFLGSGESSGSSFGSGNIWPSDFLHHSWQLLAADLPLKAALSVTVLSGHWLLPLSSSCSCLSPGEFGGFAWCFLSRRQRGASRERAGTPGPALGSVLCAGSPGPCPWLGAGASSGEKMLLVCTRLSLVMC